MHPQAFIPFHRAEIRRRVPVCKAVASRATPQRDGTIVHASLAHMRVG